MIKVGQTGPHPVALMLWLEYTKQMNSHARFIHISVSFICFLKSLWCLYIHLKLVVTEMLDIPYLHTSSLFPRQPFLH